jgi:L-2-hydroxyglutarate oxidase LhgO
MAYSKGQGRRRVEVISATDTLYKLVFPIVTSRRVKSQAASRGESMRAWIMRAIARQLADEDGAETAPEARRKR